MRLLYVSDFNVTRGSGYATIATHLCTELAEMGHDVTVLALNWDRSAHRFPFRVIPSEYVWIPVQVVRLQQALDFDHVLLAMDVPKLVQLGDEVRRQALGWPPHSALFPVESAPLVGPWVDGLTVGNRHRFVISHFGRGVLEEAGVDSHYLPVTAELPADPVDPVDARRGLHEYVRSGPHFGRSELLDAGGTFVLTVADNQERKDLPVLAQALGMVPDAVWLLVTRARTSYGWYLPDLLKRCGMAERTLVFDGLPPEVLDLAYWAADRFALASQAEGACLPLYEALAHDLLPVAPDHTAITEVLEDGRGVLIEPEWITLHPWGNVLRWHVSAEMLAEAIRTARHPGNGNLVEYIANRPWSQAAEVIETVLEEGMDE